MNQFSIKDIEHLSGIKAHTLRIWEQRYGILVPKRKVSNHRFYDNDDLKSLLQIAYLYHNGIKISKIAHLKVDERKEVAKDLATKSDSSAYIINRLLEASFEFDETAFDAVLTEAIHSDGLENVMINIAYPYLEKIGLLWLTDQAIPAQEHLTSYIICRKIIKAIDDLPNTVTNDTNVVLLFTPLKEHHEIPILFIHYLLKKNGTRVIYFGANTDLSTISEYCQTMPATHLFCHLITNFTAQPLNNYVKQLHETFHNKAIIISGPKTEELSDSFNNVHLIKSLQGLLEICTNLTPYHLT